MKSSGVIVVGASGHAKVVIELLRSSGMGVSYCIGDFGGSPTCLGVPVLEGDAHMESLRSEGYKQAIIAIGDNRIRQRLSSNAIALGFELVNAISPAAVVSPSARLGRGIAVMAGAVINADSVIEDFAIINTSATIDHDCHVGKAAHVAPQCGLAGNVQIGAGALLGVGCKVNPGIRIGESAVLGAGSVVVRDIPARVLAYGVPARVVERPYFANNMSSGR